MSKYLIPVELYCLVVFASLLIADRKLKEGTHWLEHESKEGCFRKLGSTVNVKEIWGIHSVSFLHQTRIKNVSIIGHLRSR